MSRLISYMSRLTRKRLAVVALAALIVGAAALFVTLRPDAANAELRPGDTAVTSRSGTFATEVPVRGSLVFPITAELSFESPGTVGEVMVKAGQRVEKGQVLARLDPLALAALRTRVAGDELTLNAAQVDLDALLSSHPVATAQLESAVAEARLALDAARETFDEITAPDKGDLAAARSRLDDARKALDDLLDP
ncbi:MAG: biotin/lipoyl-binding protein, partial [Chloroflexi bacterium]|nr:biotin/lipoyl-binding protein [Chloroflexota bacterium]